jgi:hypothetical protein
MDFEISTETVERKFVEVGDESFPLGEVLRFVEGVQDDFSEGVGLSGLQADIADCFEDAGLVSLSHSTGYSVKNEERLKELEKRLLEE